jgi:hypothetical protein
MLPPGSWSSVREGSSEPERQGTMTVEKRDRKRLRRQRDELLEGLYELAKQERRRLSDQVSREFTEAVDALEDLDALEEEERQKAIG